MGRFGKTLDEITAAPAAPAPKKGRFGRTLDETAPPAAGPAPAEEEPDFASRAVDTASAVQDAFMPAGWRESVAGVLKKAEDATTKARDYVHAKDPSQIPIIGMTFKPATAFNVGLPETIKAIRGVVEESKTPSKAVRGAVRGVEQGLTGNYADEILGAVDTATGDRPYEQSRDGWRAAFGKSEGEAPISFEQGHQGGAMYRDASLGKALGILGPLKNILYGGATGALEGSGATEADPTKETGRFVMDTGVGAATNALMSALGPQSVEPFREKIGKKFGAKSDEAVSQVVNDLTAQKAATEGELKSTQDQRKGLFDSILEKAKARKAELEAQASTVEKDRAAAIESTLAKSKDRKARLDEKINDLGDDRARIVTERADAEHAKRRAEAQAAAEAKAKFEADVEKERHRRTSGAVKEIEGTLSDRAAKEQKKALISGKVQELLNRIEQERAKEFRSRLSEEAKGAAGQKQKLSERERRLADLAAEEAKLPEQVAGKRAQMFGEAGNRISRHEELVGPLPEDLQPVKQKIVESYRDNSKEHIRDPDVVAAEYEAGLRQKISDAREALLRESDEAGGGLAGQADPASVIGEERVKQIAAQHKIPAERIPEMLKEPEAVSRVPELEAQVQKLQSDLAGVDAPKANPLAEVDADVAYPILQKFGLEKTYPGPGKKMNVAALLEDGQGPALSDAAIEALRAERTTKPVTSDYGPFDEATAGEMSGKKGTVALDGDPRIAKILRRETRLRDASQRLGDRLENPASIQGERRFAKQGERAEKLKGSAAKLGERIAQPESFNSNPRIAKLLGKESGLSSKAQELGTRAADRPGMINRGKTELKVAASNQLADSPLKTIAGAGVPAAAAVWKVATQRMPDASFKNPEARAAFFDVLSKKVGADATLSKQYGAFIASAKVRHDLNDLLQALYYVDKDPDLAAAVGGEPAN